MQWYQSLVTVCVLCGLFLTGGTGNDGSSVPPLDLFTWQDFDYPTFSSPPPLDVNTAAMGDDQTPVIYYMEESTTVDDTTSSPCFLHPCGNPETCHDPVTGLTSFSNICPNSSLINHAVASDLGCVQYKNIYPIYPTQPLSPNSGIRHGGTSITIFGLNMNVANIESACFSRGSTVLSTNRTQSFPDHVIVWTPAADSVNDFLGIWTVSLNYLWPSQQLDTLNYFYTQDPVVTDSTIPAQWTPSSQTPSHAGIPNPVITPSTAPTHWTPSSTTSIVRTQNPSITDVQPRTLFIRGGVQITVTGRNFDKAATMIVTVTIVNSATVPHDTNVTVYTKPCQLPSGSAMICEMPVLDVIPASLAGGDVISSGQNRRRRKRQVTSQLASASAPSRHRRAAQPSAGSYTTGNKTVSVDISFMFGGLNISLSAVGINNNLVPIGVKFDHNDISFDPSTTTYITITGQNFQVGCSRNDYNISVGGAANCVVNTVTDTTLTCQPPSAPPAANTNSSRCPNSLELTATIGIDTRNVFFISCVTYKVPTPTAAPSISNTESLVVGLTVGLGGFCLLVIIVIVITCCLARRQANSKQPRRPETRGEAIVDDVGSLEDDDDGNAQSSSGRPGYASLPRNDLKQHVYSPHDYLRSEQGISHDANAQLGSRPHPIAAAVVMRPTFPPEQIDWTATGRESRA